MLTSAGDIASIPWDRENGVIPVERRGVVRCDQRTPSSSSAQTPFFSSRCFLIPSRIVLFVASVCLFP